VQTTWYPSRFVRTSVGYAWSHFEFEDEQHAGNRVPGTPPHRVMGDLSVTVPGGVVALVRLEGVSRYFVDSSNEHVNEGYAVADVQAGHEGIGLGRDFRIHPFVRINNVTDTQYNGSVVVNASADRFYEPAAGRVWQAGINVTWR
jgi:iron complex outermembrane recepter protein